MVDIKKCIYDDTDNLVGLDDEILGSIPYYTFFCGNYN